VTRFASFFVVLILIASFSAPAAAGQVDSIAQDQQAALYELNAARWNPAAWGDQHGTDLSDFLPQPPLAVNPNLMGSTNFKANEMAEFGITRVR